MVAQLVKLLKDSSLGFIIGFEELMRSGRISIEYLGGEYAIPVYTAIALFYLVTNMTLSWSARKIERRTMTRTSTKETITVADE